MRRVVVTGMGVVVPSGVGVEQFWCHSNQGISYVRHEPAMVDMGLKSHVLARVADFCVSDHLPPDAAAEVAGLSRFTQFGVTAGAMAAEQAGLRNGACPTTPSWPWPARPTPGSPTCSTTASSAPSTSSSATWAARSGPSTVSPPCGRAWPTL